MNKQIKFVTLFLFLLITVGAYAQKGNTESVVYLKSGTIYRGKIVDQVFNESITVQLLTGEKIKVPVADVQKVSEEKVKIVKPPFHYPGRQFFFQGQVMLGFLEEGFRVTAGYRFGQFGIIGGGVGVDFFQIGYSSNVNNTDPYAGIYFPVFVHYEGDILKKRVTPFYSAEAGYAFRTGGDDSYISVTPLNNPVYKNLGGFTGGVGFGVKLYGRHKVYATWSVDLDIKEAIDKYSNSYINSIGENIKVSYSSSSLFLMPAVKIAVGF